MNIAHINNYQTFSSIQLYSTELVDKNSAEKKRAIVYLLEPKDIDNIEAVRNKLATAPFGEAFLEAFDTTIGIKDNDKVANFAAKNNKFFVVEIDKDAPFSERLKAFAKATIGFKKVRLETLSSLKDRELGYENLRGAGSAILFALADILSKRENSGECISLVCPRASKDFYTKSFFKRPPNNADNYLELPRDDYEKLKRLLQPKYNIRPLITYNRIQAL